VERRRRWLKRFEARRDGGCGSQSERAQDRAYTRQISAPHEPLFFGVTGASVF
jgi:hypothetical protein